jgi:hypothetical protein
MQAPSQRNEMAGTSPAMTAYCAAERDFTLSHHGQTPDITW